MLDSVAIIVYANNELNLRRRELIKPDLNRQYASLCSTQVPVTGLLFGDNLSQQCKDIQETNKLGQKFGHRFVSPGSETVRNKQHRRDAKPFYRTGQFRQGNLNSSRQRNWQRKKSADLRQSAVAK